MNPRRLSARNWRSWKQLDCELPEGVCAVVGPNGAGKSSLVSLVDYALFGDRFLSRHVSRGADSLTVSCEFEAGGSTYLVERSAGQRTALRLHRVGARSEVGRHEEILTRTTIADTQALIGQLVGMTRETFRASAYLAQGDGAAFTEAPPRERKAVLAEILGLGVWGRLEERARREHSAVEADVQRRGGRLDQLHSELEDLPERQQAVEWLAEEVAARRRDAEAAERLLAAYREAQAAAAAGRQAREALRHTIADRDSTHRALESARSEATLPDFPDRGQLTAMAAVLGSAQAVLEKRREEHARWLDERARFRSDERRLDELERTKQKWMATPLDRCPTCGQPVESPDALDRVAAERDALEDEAVRLETRPPLSPEPDLTGDEARLAEATRAAQALERRALAEQSAERAKERAEEAAARLRALDARIAELEPAAQTADVTDVGTEARAAQAQEALREARDRLSRAQADVERLALTRATYERETAAQAVDGAELALLSQLIRAYGRDGVPAMITEHVAIPHIEAEAGRILADLGTDFSVELRTQRLTAKGEARDALDIIVRSGQEEAPYESFSGGERTRLNLSLRIALARLLAHRRGANVRCLILDEPEFIDSAGMERLAGVLAGLTDDFEKVIAVSHHDALRHAFDQVIEVERNGEGSVLV